MRAVLATYDDDPPVGGQGVYVRGLRSALQARGVEVRTVAGRGANRVPVPRITGRAPIDLSLALTRDPSPLLRPPADVVHAQGGPGGVLLLRRLPLPVVYTAHHTYRQAYAPTALRRLLSMAERRAYARAAMVLAVSPSTATAVRALGVPAGRVEVVPPGIDLDRLAVGAAVAREPGRVLFAGRLEPEKGAVEAVAVLGELVQRRPGIHGVVVGSGSRATAVAAAARRCGSAVEVRGAVSDEELAQEYARAAVVILPSRYEGLGMVALEAMAAGAAVVAHDVTGLRDAVGDRGVLVPPGDGAAMVAACLALLDDEARRAEHAQRGREHVLAEHAWPAVAARVEQVYRAVSGG